MHTAGTLNCNTFDLIQHDLVASAVIELGGARTFVAEERQAQVRQAQREAAAERPVSVSCMTT
jgi:hypothetical protein